MSTPLRFDRLTIADKLYYERVKKVLDKSKHPGFLGREVVFRCAERGVVIVAALDDQDVGVVLVDHKHTLGTLSVIPGARKHGVGGALVREARPFARFVKAIADRVGYFERLGYRPCGAPTIGAAGKMLTQLMERVDDDAFHAEGAPIVVSLSPIEPELKSETATDRRKREDAERRDAKEAKTNRLRELSLLELIPELTPHHRPPEHLRSWCEIIERASSNAVRAMCSIPIRHYKTETTVHGIVYLLLKHPDWRIIFLTHSAEAANKWGKRIRQIAEATTVGPTTDWNTIAEWRNAAGGGVVVMSADQSKIGYDCDALIVDDPLDELHGRTTRRFASRRRSDRDVTRRAA